MKKHILMITMGLLLSNDLSASEDGRGEHYFRPAFQKKLKRVKSVSLGSFKSLGLKQKTKKKEVFIDWRKLYWGNLKELIYSEEETYPDDFQELGGTEEQNTATIDFVETQTFAKELRQELKAFAKQYGFKIVWQKKSLDLLDATAAFLEYWDRGLSQEEQSKVVPFADLCSLNSKDESVGDTSIKDTKSKEASVHNASVALERESWLNLFLKKGA